KSTLPWRWGRAATGPGAKGIPGIAPVRAPSPRPLAPFPCPIFKSVAGARKLRVGLPEIVGEGSEPDRTRLLIIANRRVGFPRRSRFLAQTDHDEITPARGELTVVGRIPACANGTERQPASRTRFVTVGPISNSTTPSRLTAT